MVEVPQIKSSSIHLAATTWSFISMTTLALPLNKALSCGKEQKKNLTAWLPILPGWPWANSSPSLSLCIGRVMLDSVTSSSVEKPTDSVCGGNVWADKKRVREFTQHCWSTYASRGGALGVSVTGFSGTRRNRPLWKCKVAVAGSCRGWFQSEIFRETYSFVWLWWLAQWGFLDSEVTWPPAPLALVPTAGVVVGNRGETLSREQSGRRRKGEKKKKKTRLKKSQALFRVFSKPLNSEAWQAIGKVFLVVATNEWLLCRNDHSSLSRLGAQRPPKASRKRETQKPSMHFWILFQ